MISGTKSMVPTYHNIWRRVKKTPLFPGLKRLRKGGCETRFPMRRSCPLLLRVKIFVGRSQRWYSTMRAGWFARTAIGSSRERTPTLRGARMAHTQTHKFTSYRGEHAKMNC
jgi:hypothetical protein